MSDLRERLQYWQREMIGFQIQERMSVVDVLKQAEDALAHADARITALRDETAKLRSELGVSAETIDALGGSVRTWADRAEAAEQQLTALREALQKVDDLCEAILMRGDLQYGLGQIQGVVADALRASGEGK